MLLLILVTAPFTLGEGKTCTINVDFFPIFLLSLLPCLEYFLFYLIFFLFLSHFVPFRILCHLFLTQPYHFCPFVYFHYCHIRIICVILFFLIFFSPFLLLHFLPFWILCHLFLPQPSPDCMKPCGNSYSGSLGTTVSYLSRFVFLCLNSPSIFVFVLVSDHWLPLSLDDQLIN